MRKPQPVGLVAEGTLTNSILLRLPSVLDNLGPVKGKTNRLARRVSNFLRAGSPIGSYEELDGTRLVLIRVPDASVETVVAELSEASLDLTSKSFVLCETWLPSDVLRPLSVLGAMVATAVVLPSSRGKWFLLEGDPSATRQMRRLVENSHLRGIEMKHRSKELLFAAELFAGVLPMALLGQAEHALRIAGFSGKQLFSLLEGATHRMFSDVTHNRLMTAAMPLADCSDALFESYLRTLESKHPELAAYLKLQLDGAGLSALPRPSAKLKGR